jgi:glutamine amidotransferase
VIAIIDYQAGNLTSVERALRHLGADCQISRDPEFIAAAERIVFPGVGAAGSCMNSLRALGLDRVLREAVAAGKPVLGICIGCQVVFERSEEDLATCLGLLPGEVVRFPADMPAPEGGVLKVPHMGWNGVEWQRPHPVFAGVHPQAEFYFVHSYYPRPADPALVVGTTHYGLTFASAVAWGSLVAVQFHVEKSGRPGLKILENFLAWDGREEGHAQ